MDIKKPELLSPSGNPDGLRYAVYNGADAVYLGLNKFNARAKAENFDENNIAEYVNFAHLYGVKVYVALNTLIKNNEISEFIRLFEFAAKANVDAYIIQSIGIARLIKKIYPQAVLHASTQMGIHNKYGAKLCLDEGIKRVILSRECTIEDIKDISDNVDIEIEAFIHGALCSSFSGNCYMSSFISCNSGNRGLCLQPCRMPYEAYNKKLALKRGYLLSLADMCVGEDIKKLGEAGVTSFKIEGRLKRPEYTGGVTRYYRKIIDGIKINETDDYNIKALFNRGDFTKGYYFKSDNISSQNHQGHKGVNIGNVLSVNRDILEVKSKRSLCRGDAFKLFDENNSEIGNAVFLKRKENNIYCLSYKGRAQKGTFVNITTDSELNNKILSYKKLLSAEITFSALLNKPCIFKIKHNDTEIEIASDYINEQSHNIAMTEEELKQKLNISDGIFESDKINILYDKNCFIPLSVISTLKREGLFKLKQAILEKYKKAQFDENYSRSISNINSTMQSKLLCNTNKKAVIINDKDQLIICKKAETIIYRPNNYNMDEVNSFIDNTDIKEISYKLYLYIPSFCNKKDIEIIENILCKSCFAGLYINNISGIYMAKKHSLKLFFGIGINLYNDYDLAFAKEYTNDYAYSFELSKNQIERLNSPYGYVYAYGDISLMTLKYCIVKSIYGNDCSSCKYKGEFILKDGREAFCVSRYTISDCRFNILNGKKLNILKKEIPKNNLIFDFTNENKDIIHSVFNLEVVNGDYTAGHYYRGLK